MSIDSSAFVLSLTLTPLTPCPRHPDSTRLTARVADLTELPHSRSDVWEQRYGAICYPIQLLLRLLSSPTTYLYVVCVLLPGIKHLHYCSTYRVTSNNCQDDEEETRMRWRVGKGRKEREALKRSGVYREPRENINQARPQLSAKKVPLFIFASIRCRKTL